MSTATSTPGSVRWLCPTLCDDDCDETCHEVHQPRWKRYHVPEQCISRIGPQGFEGSNT